MTSYSDLSFLCTGKSILCGFNYSLLCFQNVVMRLQNDWLGHWISLLIGHYTEPENEERVTSFVDQLLEQYVEGGDVSL